MSAALARQPAGWGLFAPAPEPKQLFEHQSRALDLLRRAMMGGISRVVLQLPTGAGKTVTASAVIAGALAKGKRVAFTVPAISLIDQTVAAFEGQGIDAIGVIQANHVRTNWAQPVQVVSVQTLARRQRPHVDLVIVDECHIQHQAIIDWMTDCPDVKFIGLSATPWAKGMGDAWQDLIAPVSMQDLIDGGFLSPFRVYAPSSPDLSRVRVSKGDYETGQLSEVMSGTALIADVVQTWKQRARGLPTLVFAVDRAQPPVTARPLASKPRRG